MSDMPKEYLYVITYDDGRVEATMDIKSFCAKYGMDDERVRIRISNAKGAGYRYKGMHFNRYSIWAGNAVIGTDPQGREWWFESPEEVAAKVGSFTSSIRDAISNKEPHGGWMWRRAVPSDEATKVPITAEALGSLTFLKRRKVVPIPDGDGEDADPLDLRKPIATGYYSQDVGFFVCPGCKKALINYRENGYAHLEECLAGRVWKIKHNIVKVYE